MFRLSPRRVLAILWCLSGSSVFAAEQSSTLTVYTYQSFTSEWGAGPKIKAGFEASCDGCTLEFVALDNSAGILNRVQLEGARSRADVVLGLDTNLMALAEQSGLLAPHRTDLSEIELPIEWESDLFVPFDYGYFAFIYDTETLPEPPRSFAELIGSPTSPRIIIQDPRTSTTGLGLLLWMKAIYGDQAADQWAALERRVLTVTSGWSEAYFTLFMNGEAPMVLSYSTSPAYHMAIDNTDRYQAVAFDEGHYLQIELAAIVKSSTKQDLANDFLQYLISEEAQAMLPLTNVMYPVRDIGDQLPAAFDRLISPSRSLLIEPATVGEQRKRWVDEWLEAMSR